MAKNQIACPVCGDLADCSNLHNYRQEIYDCNTCGGFSIGYNYLQLTDRNILSHFLYYNCNLFSNARNRQSFYFIGDKVFFNEVIKIYPHSIFISADEIYNWYPRSFSEKIDFILLALAKKFDYTGKSIALIGQMANSMLFVNRYIGEIKCSKENIEEQLEYSTSYMIEQKLVKKDICNVTLLPLGSSRVDELQKNQSNSKQVFVAMAFSEDMKNIREAIREGIVKSGYVPRFIDEKEHNKQIVPEILYEIRKSKFIIAELTGHNNGAYYEAGYAAGLGKEVIHICSKETFGADGHFDVKQKSTILWNNENEISTALYNRIEATIGLGNK